MTHEHWCEVYDPSGRCTCDLEGRIQRAETARLQAALASQAEEINSMREQLRKEQGYVQRANDENATLRARIAEAERQEPAAWVHVRKVDVGVGMDTEAVLLWEQSAEDDEPLFDWPIPPEELPKPEVELKFHRCPKCGHGEFTAPAEIERLDRKPQEPSDV